MFVKRKETSKERLSFPKCGAKGAAGRPCSAPRAAAKRGNHYYYYYDSCYYHYY